MVVGANFDSGKPSSTEVLPNGTGEHFARMLASGVPADTAYSIPFFTRHNISRYPPKWRISGAIWWNAGFTEWRALVHHLSPFSNAWYKMFIFRGLHC